MFQFLTIINNVVGVGICEVGGTVESLNIGS
jgi:hypothetical protein